VSRAKRAWRTNRRGRKFRGPAAPVVRGLPGGREGPPHEASVENHRGHLMVLSASARTKGGAT
jgi:hypothetical protein